MHYDVVIIGGGMGGINAATQAANRGAKVAVIEGHRIGGIRINWGASPPRRW
jgi:dihydrolipoamide dehydrogenase